MMRLDVLPNQLPDERIELFLRRHWIDLVRIFLFTALLIAIPAVILILLNVTGTNLLEHAVFGPLGALLLSSYLFVVLVITMTEITDYWLDVWIVTTERIINIEQHGLFKRLVSEVYLDQIQDVTSETKGLIETFLTFGDVYIQTAATKERFQFKNIDNPDKVKIHISKLSKECKLNHTHAHEHPVELPEA